MTSTYTRSSLISHSRKSSNCGDRSPRVTFKDAPEDYNELKSDPNVKMQKELLTLQTRVLELEMKLSSFTSPTAINSTKANGNRNSSLTFSSTQDISKLNSGLMTSQRATLLDQSRRNISTIRASPILQQNQLESRASPEGYSRVMVRSSSGLSTQMTNRKSTSRKTLKTEMNDYSSDNFLSVSRSISSMSTKNKTKKGKIEKIYDENDDEATRLYKYIKVLRREYHSDKAELIKERVRGNELAEKLRKLERKINKLDTNLNVASKVQEKYEDLIESFGKSETMRKQQRALIESLNSELNVLKGEDELPREEMAFETSKSKILVSRSTSKKSHSKIRTAKVF